MMINKRLVETVGDAKKYIGRNVALQWCALAANIVIVFAVGNLLEKLLLGSAGAALPGATAAVLLAAAAVRFACARGAARAGFLASRSVKKTLREMIYKKLLRLGPAYAQKVPTAEAVQLAAEGVEQLETYFGAYLPQLFYSMLAPVTLFLTLSMISVKAAVVLMICVPLIPVSIVAVQKFAKRLLGRYWGQYAALGDSFLENLQGLTTLKIYQADEQKRQEMHKEAEHFRRVTMKVLIGFLGCFAIVLLSAEFFLPLRALGSFFHVAMNGMAASDKIFRLLDLPERAQSRQEARGGEIALCGVRFAYEPEREILRGVDMTFAPGSFTAIVGESGCGKSTVAALLTGRNAGYGGSVTLGGAELAGLNEASLMRTVTLVSHNSYLFKGTVRESLQMGDDRAGDEALWRVLERVRLADFLRAEKGLDTPLTENAGNLSGGQRQRLALARALLHDSPVYIFDEATSNIDVESENDIMELIHSLAKSKTVILISHRLANAAPADKIYVMKAGRVVQQGTHAALLAEGGLYETLWENQQALEQYAYTKEAAV